MILIISQETTSVSEVIDWLTHYKSKYIRVNHKDKRPCFHEIRFDDNLKEFLIEFAINEKIYNLNMFKSYWIRHGFLSFDNRLKINSKLSQLYPDLEHNVKNQNRTLYDFVLKELEKKRGLGSEKLQNSNKLNSLFLASECGLIIPETRVLSSKSQLKSFLDSKSSLITKSIQDVVFLKDNNEVSINYTERIDENMLCDFPEVFAPSLFQELVEKTIEIRTFYLNGKCYSMAIFSQNDKQTTIDFRKYNDTKPNRTIPFRLPKELEGKIEVYMNKMGLRTGSLDFIYSLDKEFVFLEVNPVGQFGMVSHPCNYYLEEKIAKYLIAEHD